MGKKHKVIIMRCDEYDAQKIGLIIKKGMEELQVKPSGRVLLKPNVVLAHPEIFPHAFTRKEFLDGVLTAVKARIRKDQGIGRGGAFRASPSRRGSILKRPAIRR